MDEGHSDLSNTPVPHQGNVVLDVSHPQERELSGGVVIATRLISMAETKSGGLRALWIQQARFPVLYLSHNQHAENWRVVRDDPSHKWVRTAAFPTLYMVPGRPF